MDPPSSSEGSEQEFELEFPPITGQMHIDIKIFSQLDLKSLDALCEQDDDYMRELCDKTFKEKFKEEYGEMKLMKRQTWKMMYGIFSTFDEYTDPDIDRESTLDYHFRLFEFAMLSGYTNIIDYITNSIKFTNFLGQFNTLYNNGDRQIGQLYDNIHRNTLTYLLHKHFKPLFDTLVGHAIEYDNIYIYKVLYKKYYDDIKKSFKGISMIDSPKISQFLERKGEIEINYLKDAVKQEKNKEMMRRKIEEIKSRKSSLRGRRVVARKSERTTPPRPVNRNRVPVPRSPQRSSSSPRSPQRSSSSPRSPQRSSSSPPPPRRVNRNRVAVTSRKGSSSSSESE